MVRMDRRNLKSSLMMLRKVRISQTKTEIVSQKKVKKKKTLRLLGDSNQQSLVSISMRIPLLPIVFLGIKSSYFYNDKRLT